VNPYNLTEKMVNPVRPIPDSQMVSPKRVLPNLSDLMLIIAALALSAALIKSHSEDSTLKFRLSNHPPVSVWTRLLMGHTLTAFGLILGASRWILTVRKREREIAFGNWFWITISLYLVFYLSASMAWAFVNLVRQLDLSSISQTRDALGRVFLLTSQQACFDQFAWMVLAVWLATRLTQRSSDLENLNSVDTREIHKQDYTVSVYSGMVIASTMVQRFIESAGY